MKPCSRSFSGRCGGYRLPDCPLGCLLESGGWRAVACCLLLLPVGDVCGDPPEPPIQLGSRRELMLDAYLFSSLKNLKFRFTRPAWPKRSWSLMRLGKAVAIMGSALLDTL